MNTSFDHKDAAQNQRPSQRENQSAKAYPSRTIVHAKLEMTDPGDHDEQEADAIADAVVSGGKIARKISGGGGSSGITVSQQMESQLSQLQGGGRQMPEGLRNIMESGFGQDFSQVRLHTDSEAANMSSSIHAKAFTLGNDIYFNQGQFSPNTTEGQRLVAHELTHVVQGTGKVGRKDLSSYKGIVKGIFKDANSSTFDTIWEHYITYKGAFEMDNDWNLAHFFAQVYGESSHLTPKETISYSVYRLAQLFSAFRENGKPNATAWRLGLFDEKTWKKNKNKPYWSEDDLNKHPAKTSISSEEQKEIASISYANKYGNGDVDSGDGWRYRGRGLLQLTFKDNYQRRQKTINKLTNKNIDIVNNPDEVSNNLEINALTAMAYWHDRELHTKCENKKDTKEMTDAINKYADDKTRKKRQDAFDTIASGIGLN